MCQPPSPAMHTLSLPQSRSLSHARRARPRAVSAQTTHALAVRTSVHRRLSAAYVRSASSTFEHVRARHATRSTERPGGAPGRARRAGRAHGMPECMQAAAGNRTKPYRCAHTLCAESGGGTTPLLLTHIEKTRWGVRRRTSRSTQLGQSSAADTFTHLARGSGQVRIRVRDSCTTGARRTERRACTRRVESYHRGESGQPP